MFHKILLPIDLSDRHGRAVEMAAQLAGQSNGEIILLHVIDVIRGLDADEEKSFYGRLKKLAAAHLEKIGNLVKQKHVPFRQKILLGNRGAETVRYARENAIDLIIVTTPPVDPEQIATGWGSLSCKIGLAAACPVLLVK